MIQIGNLTANRAEKVQGYYRVEGTEFQIPVTIVCGQKEGKTILVTCGIHGSEYPGIVTGIELAKEMAPQEFAGNLIILHPVNLSGFHLRNRDQVPTDGKNLNRVFPGHKEGTLAQRIAYAMTTEFFPLADFYMDLHGGDMFERVIPYAHYPGVGDQKVIEESLEAAKLLHINYTVRSSATTGAYNSAAIAGTPSILIERGGDGVWNWDEVAAYKLDVYNILRHYGCLSGKVERPNPEPQDIAHAQHMHALENGCWYPQVQVGQQVFKGQKTGEIRDVFDNLIREEVAPYDGVVLYMTSTLAVEKGKSLIAFGQL